MSIDALSILEIFVAFRAIIVIVRTKVDFSQVPPDLGRHLLSTYQAEICTITTPNMTLHQVIHRHGMQS